MVMKMGEIVLINVLKIYRVHGEVIHFQKRGEGGLSLFAITILISH